MKYLNTILLLIAVLLFLILIKLSTLDGFLRKAQDNDKALIAANQKLEVSLTDFKNLLEPVVKKYFKR